MSIGDDLERRAQRGTPRGPDDVWTSDAVQAALRRKKIPFWAVPVLAFLPIWAVIFVGGLSEAGGGDGTQLDEGAAIYEASCSGCHGPSGEGGPGRPLHRGEVVATFPDIVDHLTFVSLGSDGIGTPGTPYGDPGRQGGVHETYGYNGSGMPPFAESLTDAELLAVVRHEREVLAGATVPPEQLGADGELLWPDGSPLLSTDGRLVTREGIPLLDPGTGPTG